MKKLLIATLFVSSTLSVNAGSVAYIAPDAVTFEEPAMMGGSGTWLIPLVIVAVLALALSQDNCNPKEEKCLL